jgi:hypothetical protein
MARIFELNGPGGELLGLSFYNVDVIFINLESEYEIRGRYARNKPKSKARRNAWQSIPKLGRCIKRSIENHHRRLLKDNKSTT